MKQPNSFIRQVIRDHNALVVQNLGGGVQSTTGALAAEQGLIPKPDLSIFADTMREPEMVYHHMHWLCGVELVEVEEIGGGKRLVPLPGIWQKGVLSWPVHVVSTGDIQGEVYKAQHEERWDAIPFHVATEDGGGMLGRSCTRKYKLYAIRAEIKRILGYETSQAVKKTERPVICQIGISLDEVHRAKDSDVPWITNEFPLLDLGWTRNACLIWLQENGYPDPPKSACYFCPFRSNASWLNLKEKSPEDFERACKLDEQLREEPLRGVKGVPYVHFSRKPLREVNLNRHRPQGQTTLADFGIECEGMCGV